MNPDPNQPLDGISPTLANILASKPVDHPQTDADMHAELSQMEGELFDTLVAITNASTGGLLAGVGLQYRNGQPEVTLLIKNSEGIHPLSFTGLNLVDALISAGVDLHGQLMLLHGKTNKLADYVSWYATRRKLRDEARKKLEDAKPVIHQAPGKN